MKTVLLPIYHGIRARNFFRTDTYPLLLADPELRLVIVVPTSKLAFYTKEFGHERVNFVPLDIQNEPRFGQMLYTIAVQLMPTNTMRIKHLMAYKKHRNPFKLVFWRTLNYVLGPLRATRSAIRFFDRFVPVNPEIAQLLEQWKPDFVLAPDSVFPIDLLFLRAARRAQIPTIGLIRSWDNLTAKGVLIVMPDWMIVHTTTLREEAATLNDVPRERIIVTGPSQFDLHFSPRSVTREQFLASLGIPTDRKVVLCAPFFNDYSGSALEIIKGMLRAIDDGRLPSNTHLIVRYRPASAEIAENEIPKDPHITVTKPCELSFPTKGNIQMPQRDYEYTARDMDLLMNSLAYSDVVINTISTLSIDAAAFDKPVINVRFDADPSTPDKYSVKLWTGHDHYEMIEATKGVQLAWSMDELVAKTADYLAHPEHDREGRKRIVESQIERTDGHSGERLAKELEKIIHA